MSGSAQHACQIADIVQLLRLNPVYGVFVT